MAFTPRMDFPATCRLVALCPTPALSRAPMTASAATRGWAVWLSESWRLLSRRALTARCSLPLLSPPTSGAAHVPLPQPAASCPAARTMLLVDHACCRTVEQHLLRSGTNDLPKTLSLADLVFLGLGSIIGAGGRGRAGPRSAGLGAAGQAGRQRLSMLSLCFLLSPSRHRRVCAVGRGGQLSGGARCNSVLPRGGHCCAAVGAVLR